VCDEQTTNKLNTIASEENLVKIFRASVTKSSDYLILVKSNNLEIKMSTKKNTESSEIKPEKSDDKKESKDPKQGLKHDSKDDKIAELTDSLQRLQAEFENYHKRIEKDFALSRKYQSQDLIVKLLPILDTFEIAIKSMNSCDEKLLKGVKLIYAQFYSTLELEGLRPIDTRGKRFDPHYHEVMLQEINNSVEDETILEELQKGYMLYDRVIRFSKVKISRKPDEKKQEEKQPEQEKEL